jgi:hypothetical protein
MGRYSADACKSKGRKLLFDLWPSTLSKEDRPRNCADVVIQDGLQLVMDMGHQKWDQTRAVSDTVNATGGEEYDLATLVSRVKYQIDGYFNYSNNLRYYAMLFDKVQFVPVSKSQVQLNRDASATLVSDLDHELCLEPSFLLTPETFDAYMSDRVESRRKIIAFIVMELLCGENRLRLPAGRKFMVDGHGLVKEELRHLKVINADFGKESVGSKSNYIDKNLFVSSQEMIPDDEGFNDVGCYPLVCCAVEDLPEQYRVFLKGRDDLDESDMCCYLDKSLSNVIGEADFTPFFLMRKFGERKELYETYEIASIDTDLTYLSLLYLERCMVQSLPIPNIYIRQSRVYYRKDVQYVNVNALYKVIHNEARLRCLKYRVSSLVVAMLTGGSDYTDPHYYVPYNHYLNAILKRADLIGDLISWKPKRCFDSPVKFSPEKSSSEKDGEYTHPVRLNGKAYVKLLLHTYIEARKERIPAPAAQVLECTEINDYLDGTEGSRKSLDPAKLFPDESDVTKSAHQLQYYIDMCFSVGESNVEHLNPLYYGYEMLDEERGLSRGNLRRTVTMTGPITPRKRKNDDSDESITKGTMKMNIN